MAICHLCLRNLLTGERYRLFASRNAAAERPVCRLCEEAAQEAGWVRLDRPTQVERGPSPIWHARKVA